MDILPALMAMTATLRKRGHVDNGAYARGSVGAEVAIRSQDSR
ncbi:hypothetical protein SAMN02745172_02440 [Pseudoxanthobacter soli DSM 19599]|uniref:Uncharacterized protein n=1 Tax=Pseudoxanthobacter soli DSM 19599 TaxID=1123029 RepID=A0A1M7ZLL5_9HYPH|nr:hypothetical protein [Pseudoxanthobacter soli]SHO65793.1 hypothetical protein SAMN02745172_02440 [Pseudoxanthobacter soli DSM 19599]